MCQLMIDTDNALEKFGLSDKGGNQEDGWQPWQMPRLAVDMAAAAAGLPAAGRNTRTSDSGSSGTAIGVPVHENGVFPWKEGNAITCADRDIHTDGAVVDHHELNLLGADIEGGEDIGEGAGACQRMVPTAAGRNRDGSAQRAVSDDFYRCIHAFYLFL